MRGQLIVFVLCVFKSGNKLVAGAGEFFIASTGPRRPGSLKVWGHACAGLMSVCELLALNIVDSWS